jgi:Cysteine-rich secretory protein family
MRSNKSLFFLTLGLASLLTFSHTVSAQVSLGDPPTAPKDVSGLPGKIRRADVTAGFSVNTYSREQMRSFYNAVYNTSTGIPINSTSDITVCFPGTNATAFQNAVARRINWFRAAAGIPANITLDPGNSTTNQAAALIMSANDILNHYPPSTYECYSSAGSAGASNSNIALGYAGADAITGYISDFGSSNSTVGHRRWILYPQTQVMGTGDVPAQGSFQPANATWVFDANLRGPRPATTQPYVAWPPAGYLPYQLAFPQWSFALSNADLSAATVTMKSNGVNLVISNQPYSLGYGENTLVWYPANLNPATTVAFPFSGADTVYSIVVTNIVIGSVITGFAYTVTLFDPSVPGSDYIPTTISGPTHPSVGLVNNYTCAPLNNPSLTGYQWLVAQTNSGNLFDGAENGSGNFTANISSGYSFVTNGPVASGQYSYYLAMPTAVDQTLQLNETLYPAANTVFSFAHLLGYATTNQIAEVQITTNGGLYWQSIYIQPGNNAAATSFTTNSFSFSSLAGQAVLLRFNYHYSPGGNGLYYPQIQTNSPPIGWFIDNIVIANTAQFVNASTNATSSTNFTFTPTQSGEYFLAAAPVIFNQFPTGFGPITSVSAVVVPVITLAQPVIASNLVKLNFSITGSSATTFKLLQASQINGSWTTNTTAVLTTNALGLSYYFTTSIGSSTLFYRIQTP